MNRRARRRKDRNIRQGDIVHRMYPSKTSNRDTYKTYCGKFGIKVVSVVDQRWTDSPVSCLRCIAEMP